MMSLGPALARAAHFFDNKGDRLNSLRRHAEMFCDQTIVRLRHRLGQVPEVEPFDGQVRYALITVNFSTTRYLKLMLLTLAQQRCLDLISDLVIVDNDCRDDGRDFLRRLASRVSKIHLVENDVFPTHARGMRKGIDLIRSLDAQRTSSERPNVLLFCDTDIVFRNPEALHEVADRFANPAVGFVGELRHGVYPLPEAQASFFAVRRDCYDRPSTTPVVHHGAPAYFMQRSLHRAGIQFSDFPSNFGGYILHRGRSGVAATRKYRKHDAHATAATYEPHFMGVPSGQQIWEAIEAEHEATLGDDERVIERLSSAFALVD